MGIKSWLLSKPYWLRGGIIGGIISIILTVIFIPCVIVLVGVPGTICLLPLWPGVLLFWFIQDNLYLSFGTNGELHTAAMNILNFLVWLSIGIVIGWLVGKIKSKL